MAFKVGNEEQIWNKAQWSCFTQRKKKNQQIRVILKQNVDWHFLELVSIIFMIWLHIDLLRIGLISSLCKECTEYGQN